MKENLSADWSRVRLSKRRTHWQSRKNNLPSDNLSKVKVEMKIQQDFPMKVDMVATTGAMGITLKYVEIAGGKMNQSFLNRV